MTAFEILVLVFIAMVAGELRLKSDSLRFSYSMYAIECGVTVLCLSDAFSMVMGWA